MRGFGSGLVWGGVIGALGLVVVSEVSPMPGAPVAPPAEAPSAALPETAPDAPVVAAPAEPTEPATQDAAAADTEAAAPTATEPAPPPETASQAAEPAEPEIAGVEPPAGSEFLRPLAEVDPALPEAGMAPQSTGAPVVSAPETGLATPEPDTEAAREPELDLAVPAEPPAPAEAPEAPVVAALDQPRITPEAVEPPAAPEVEPAPDTADLPPPPPLTEEEQALVETAPEIVPEGAAAQLPSDPPLVPVDPLPADDATAVPDEAADGVKVGRLPQIGDDAAAAPAAEPDPGSLPPIDRFARRFDNPEGKPTFAIILLDDGAPDLDRAALAALPFPVTFALDPTLPDAAALAAIYRAAGQEVVMLAAGIPQGATASDLEVTFAANADALPEAVAVLDLPSGGFQSDRPLATLVVPVVAGQGRGLLTYDEGLNPADQVASREGLRAATIFRKLDADGEPRAAIRRYLDRAAFKAAQDGSVAVMGTTRPETVSALVEWSLEGRAAAVALAPATAVMTAR